MMKFHGKFTWFLTFFRVSSISLISYRSNTSNKNKLYTLKQNQKQVCPTAHFGLRSRFFCQLPDPRLQRKEEQQCVFMQYAFCIIQLTCGQCEKPSSFVSTDYNITASRDQLSFYLHIELIRLLSDQITREQYQNYTERRFASWTMDNHQNLPEAMFRTSFSNIRINF